MPGRRNGERIQKSKSKSPKAEGFLAGVPRILPVLTCGSRRRRPRRRPGVTKCPFTLGRLITDNVLLAYEFTHFLNNKRKGKNGVAAIKLDMSKAYDRLELSF